MDRRWYDQEPACTQLLKQLRQIEQPEIRHFCVNLMTHFCERLRKSLANKDKVSSKVNALGITAVTSLYRFGSERRRWYDDVPELHRAVGLLYTMPREGLTVIGYKLGDVVGLLQVYSVVCQQLNQIPDQKEMSKIALAALQMGKKEAEEIIISIVGKDLYDALNHS